MAKSNIELYNESLTSAERSANAYKAGKASGVARREGRIMRDTLLNALESEDLIDKVCKVLIDKALAGDVSAIRLVRDSIGELPSLAINMEMEHREVVLFATTPEQVEAYNAVALWLPEVKFHINYLGSRDSLEGMDIGDMEITEELEE